MALYGNMIGGATPLKTLKLVDESGAEIVGVVTGSEVIFTATDNDVREGSVYASDGGVSTGTKVIPSYHTHHGSRIITSGSKFTIPLATLDRYDYTVLHCIICQWNTSLNNSVAADKVVLFDQVFPVLSTEAIANVTKDSDSKSINLGISNDTEMFYILRYMTYKEID